nr:MAG TPA: hypothetical protein [Bacteriophage sp.]
MNSHAIYIFVYFFDFLLCIHTITNFLFSTKITFSLVFFKYTSHICNPPILVKHESSIRECNP